MKSLTVLSALFALGSAMPAQAQRPLMGLSLQPVLSVTADSAGRISVVGNMPGRKQVNQAIYPAAADRFGCTALAREAASNGRIYTVLGTVERIRAINGVFTMELAAIDSCWLN